MTIPHLRIAIGPEAPEFGSWNWIGADLAQALGGWHNVLTFTDEVPPVDVVLFIKFKPPLATIQKLSQRSAIAFCPVDIYGSSAEIDADWESLRLCDLVVTHCERLTKYFAAYARARYLDHHLKYVAPPRETWTTDGPILWIGNCSNLALLVEWLRAHTLPEELWILTDLADDPAESDIGIATNLCARVERWSPERHTEWTSLARGAIEIKGSAFRARHKSPAKAHDFIASGVPVAMNREAAAVEHLGRRGFDIAEPHDTDRWLSQEYWEATQAYGRRLRTELTLENVAAQFESLLPETLKAL